VFSPRLTFYCARTSPLFPFSQETNHFSKPPPPEIVLARFREHAPSISPLSTLLFLTLLSPFPFHFRLVSFSKCYPFFFGLSRFSSPSRFSRFPFPDRPPFFLFFFSSERSPRFPAFAGDSFLLPLLFFFHLLSTFSFPPPFFSAQNPKWFLFPRVLMVLPRFPVSLPQKSPQFSLSVVPGLLSFSFSGPSFPCPPQLFPKRSFGRSVVFFQPEFFSPT